MITVNAKVNVHHVKLQAPSLYCSINSQLCSLQQGWWKWVEQRGVDTGSETAGSIDGTITYVGQDFQAPDEHFWTVHNLHEFAAVELMN